MTTSMAQPDTDHNSFLAILRTTEKKQIHITDMEYALLKEVRRMMNEKRHCQVLVGFQDGKLKLSEVNLITTFGVDKQIATDKLGVDKQIDKTGI